MIMYESNVATVHWNEETQSVHLLWHKFAKGTLLRTALVTALDVLKEKGAVNWITDTRQLGVMTLEDQQWFNEDWSPRAVQAGLAHLALVLPANLLEKMAVHSVISKTQFGSVEIAHFDGVDHAKAWLKSKRIPENTYEKSWGWISRNLEKLYGF